MLVVDGGNSPLIPTLEPYQWVNEDTIESVSTLLRSQKLSGFLAQPGSDYLGGEWVKRLEQAVADYHGHGFVISFNSWTSGLDAIFLTLDLGSGAEVIVPTWTMSATISSIVNAGYVPVFADIDLNTFNITPADVLSRLTPKTKAVCAVDLFGRPSPIIELREICDNHNLILVSDSAQAPGATINGQIPSKIADIGGYSLNRHKHLQSGEGGLVVTENEEYATRLRALRNHGEVASPGVQFPNHFLYGHNWRLGEIEALIACKQYLSVDLHLTARRTVGIALRSRLVDVEGLVIPPVEAGITHDYYVLGMRLEKGRNREFIEKALRAEGLGTLITRYSGLEKLPAFARFKTAALENATLLDGEAFIGLYLAGHTYNKLTIEGIVRAFKVIMGDQRSKL